MIHTELGLDQLFKTTVPFNFNVFSGLSLSRCVYLPVIVYPKKVVCSS